ncbi:MAG: hypothetical protein H6589_07095 [Flavobacteriales bacterium]|nr:hypothetical protein [Flavobacteriales bacterium]
MFDNEINIINTGIELYFKTTNTKKCKPKDLMPILIKLNLFEKDNRNGNPLRKVLRELYHKNKLELIPTLTCEKKRKNIYWSFIKE